MARSAFAFADPMTAVLAVLRADLAADASDEAAGATLGNRTPLQGGAPAPTLPYVLVRSDGARIEDRVVEVATVRVAVWHRDEFLGLALAQRCRAYLLRHVGATIRSVSPLSGPVPTLDPDTGAPLSYFTVSVRTRPTITL